MAPRSSAKPKPPDADLSAYGIPTFVMEKVTRGDLAGAPYNPRIIGERERRKLRAGMAKHGLVQPIVWNKRTGHVVAGHQRLAALDGITGRANYVLDVAAINVDLAAEKEINVLLNNPEAQGAWDLEKLGGILNDPGFDIAGAGFELGDVYELFGDSVQRLSDNSSIDLLADQLKGIQGMFEAMTTANEDKGSEFYMVVVFKTPAQMQAFAAAAKLPDGRYQSGEDLARLLEIKL